MTSKNDVIFLILCIFTFIALNKYRQFCKKRRTRNMCYVSSKVTTLMAKMRIYERAKGKVNMMEKSQVFSICADNFVL